MAGRARPRRGRRARPAPGTPARRGPRRDRYGSADVCRDRIEGRLDGTPRARFQAGELLRAPWPAGAFDVVVSYRLLPHVAAWKELLGELCRLARRAVLLDYPTRRSVNAAAGALFAAKKTVEGDTRPFAVFRDAEARPPSRPAASAQRRGVPILPPDGSTPGPGLAPVSRGLEAAARGLGPPAPWARRSSSGRSRVADPEWALASSALVLKQRKLAEIAAMLGPTAGLRCLDLGSDNGIVSLLLGRRGGDWASADMTRSRWPPSGSSWARTCTARPGSGSRSATRFDAWLWWTCSSTSATTRVRGGAGPRAPAGGPLVVNTPHLWTRPCGPAPSPRQTDERHGHVRPG